MNFNTFKNTIATLQQNKLGGLDAQFKLAPAIRLKFNHELIEKANPKIAAVLALFYPDKNNETQFLLTLRASYKGTHSAQISFPGGKFDKVDSDLKSTALREANEEVGLHLNDTFVFKEMTNVYIPPSNFMVTPFLATVDYKPNFKINNEVEQLIEVPLKDLLNKNSISKTTITTSYATNLDVPCFKFNNQIVWGATAMMLSEIRELFNSL
ncbi:NUDIX domain-containing protein [Lutibacter oricola]|uniref:NUDIX domain-containing protein n=1 Tax=Lutibacter oricola TaxID=762486 RepID=A0A1H3F7B5_9FLAO|nr:CoA pyrophosphatase [Lutibacter oricola]SDX86049.1 NUDIX domain-containing protein [Lutibacter oricola]